jgi:hypothetical protein
MRCRGNGVLRGSGPNFETKFVSYLAHFSEPFICLCQELRARFLFGPLCSLTAKHDDAAQRVRKGQGATLLLLLFILRFLKGTPQPGRNKSRCRAVPRRSAVRNFQSLINTRNRLV